MRKYDNDKLVSIICNKCSSVVEDLWNDKRGHKQEPYKEFDIMYGYGSRLFDLQGIKFDLCEHCVKDMINDFKISAEIDDYGIKEDGKGGLMIARMEKGYIDE